MAYWSARVIAPLLASPLLVAASFSMQAAAQEATALDRLELGRAFGRDQAVHAVVASGKIAEQLEAATRRLSGFRQHSAE